MRLALSNIAWDVAEDPAIATLLQRYQIDAIDIAPSKYFPEPLAVPAQALARVQAWWKDQGISITGMQALLFGRPELNVFGPPALRQSMLDYLEAICRIGAGVGARPLVFGSPKNRDRSGLSDSETQDLALDFFRRLGNIAQTWGVLICLEPNPPCYGANFLTTTAETAALVQALDHPAIRLQLDTGTVCINGEDPTALLRQYHPLIGHVHASEPELRPLGDGPAPHALVAQGLQHYLPQQLVSIEMRATAPEAHLLSIERALQRAIQYYRENQP